MSILGLLVRYLLSQAVLVNLDMVPVPRVHRDGGTEVSAFVAYLDSVVADFDLRGLGTAHSHWFS